MIRTAPRLLRTLHDDDAKLLGWLTREWSELISELIVRYEQPTPIFFALPVLTQGVSEVAHRAQYYAMWRLQQSKSPIERAINTFAVESRRGRAKFDPMSLGWYDRYILPRVLDSACGMKTVARERAKVVGLARGVVLEPGIGGGINLPFYDRAAVSKLIGVDPSIELGHKARQRSGTVPFAVELHSQSAELDAVAPESVDTVVLTYTLCTVPDPARVLAAAHRALKPDGVLLFCEHARAPDEGVRKWQQRLEPLWKSLAGGCHLTRDAAEQIRQGGFEIEELDQHYVEQAPRFAGFHQVGRASKGN